MVDVAISQAVVRRLNRWYRSRSQPHGTVDLNYRGTRLAYNNSYRLVSCLASLFLLGPACALFFIPGLFADKSPEIVLALKIGWAGILVVVFLAPLQAFREFLVVSDEGLMKSNLFGKQTRLDWREISRIHIKMEESEIIFFTETNTKLKTSLCYNGWQDFLEISAKHLNESLQWQIAAAVATLGKPKSVLAETSKRG
jgi:hypothetical protein